MATNKIIEGTTYSEYAEMRGINISTLLYGEISMRHLLAMLTREIAPKDSADLAFGRAFHTAALEPEHIAQRHPVTTQCTALTKNKTRCSNAGLWSGPDRKDWRCGIHKWPGDEECVDAIKPEEMERITGMLERLREHEVYSLLSVRGGVESVVLFTHPDFPELQCKARLDKLIHAQGRKPQVIVDLKKTGFGGASNFETQKAIEKYRYHQKAAWYVDGVEAVTGNKSHFVWVFVEDQPPHEINVIQADSETLEIGRLEYRSIFGRYAEALREDRWPGYSTKINQGGLSQRYRDRYTL